MGNLIQTLGFKTTNNTIKRNKKTEYGYDTNSYGITKNNLECKLAFRRCSIHAADCEFNGTAVDSTRFPSDTFKAIFHSITPDTET